MIAAKKEWCMICRTEHIENMHTNKIPAWYAETMFEESIKFVPALQIEMAYDLTILRVNECIKMHHYLHGDGCGIGNSYKFWSEVKDEVIKLKEKYLK